MMHHTVNHHLRYLEAKNDKYKYNFWFIAFPVKLSQWLNSQKAPFSVNKSYNFKNGRF